MTKTFAEWYVDAYGWLPNYMEPVMRDLARTAWDAALRHAAPPCPKCANTGILTGSSPRCVCRCPAGDAVCVFLGRPPAPAPMPVS